MHRTLNKLPLPDLYELLKEQFGAQHWWPGQSQDEIVIGAILTQSVAWRNVELALANLKNAGIVTLKDIYHTPAEIIAPLIKPTLYYNQKARKLKNFARFFVEAAQGDYQYLFSLPLEQLRARMLQINGLGQETVDSILLYAGKLPVFVCDAYTNRLLVRLGYADKDRDYAFWQSLISSSLPRDTELYNDFHAQIVMLCKHICKPKPLCDLCPLRFVCPVGIKAVNSGSRC